MFKPINIENDKVKVMIKWLVIVKLYGTNPIKLLNKINENIIVRKGKYFSALANYKCFNRPDLCSCPGHNFIPQQ